MASYSYNNDVEDEFALPPDMDPNYSGPAITRPTTHRALSPIQIDQEVTVKQKRKPAVKLIDRYPSTTDNANISVFSPTVV
jgi:hypothetical protein